MKNLTVIIPLLEDFDRTNLLKCVRTIKTQSSPPSSIVLAMSEKVNDEGNYSLSMKEVIEENSITVEKAVYRNLENPTTQDLINYGVSTIDTKFFMPMEHDEGILGTTWLQNVERYMSKYDYAIYLPLVKVIDSNGLLHSFRNEQYFAYGFTDNELGVVTEDSLKQLFEMNLTGSVIDREVYQSVGGLKNNIKHRWYWYEFILRVCYNKFIPFVIPKSLYAVPLKDLTNISNEEYHFYYETAQQEYYFKNQRDIEYKTK